MNQKNLVPFSVIVDKLEHLNQESATGTLFIVDDSSKYAQIALKYGRIVFVLYGHKRGRNALKELAKMKRGRYRFQKEILASRTDSLLDVSSILAVLRGRDRSIENETSTSTDSATTHADFFQVLEDCLTEYIGPAASLYIDEQRDIKDVQAIIDALSKEIPTAEKVQAFRAKMNLLI